MVFVFKVQGKKWVESKKAYKVIKQAQKKVCHREHRFFKTDLG